MPDIQLDLELSANTDYGVSKAVMVRSCAGVIPLFAMLIYDPQSPS